MEAAVAAELRRLAGHVGAQESDSAVNSDEAGVDSESESEGANGNSGISSADDDDDDTAEVDDDLEAAELSELADLRHTDLTHEQESEGPPSTSGRDNIQEDASASRKQPNTRDLKATGVARAAARLLEQDDADGGFAILSKSKSVAKRQREEQEESKADKAAKKMRLEMKQRGHVAVPKRGEDPEHDALEKALLKTATRGVVRLFNAVSKAQRDQKDALVGGSRSRASKLDKASFLAELRGLGQAKGTSKGTGSALPAGTGPATAAPLPQPQAQAASGWGVLSDSFGLQAGARMKDWDKQEDSDDGFPDEDLQDVTDSDSEGSE